MRLTGLPNRALLVQRLDHAVLRSHRSKKTVAVLFVDLDRFKVVNDTYGHRAGDELLIAVAERISGVIRPGDTLARLAGDEFIILCEDLESPSQAELLAERIGTALGNPFHLEVGDMWLSASVGIAFAGQGHDIPEKLIQDADTAMYQAKRRGGARFGTLDHVEENWSNSRARLTRDLRSAADQGQLWCAYQPVVAVTSGDIVGFEALLRWKHPTQGSVAARRDRSPGRAVRAHHRDRSLGPEAGLSRAPTMDARRRAQPTHHGRERVGAPARLTGISWRPRPRCWPIPTPIRRW